MKKMNLVLTSGTRLLHSIPQTGLEMLQGIAVATITCLDIDPFKLLLDPDSLF